MEKFTIEEVNLMCIYNTGTRAGLIEELKAMEAHLETGEIELLELTHSVTEKLRAMSDEEYAAISETLIPDYEEQEK